MFKALENFDYNLFFIINEAHSPLFDDIFWWISNKFIWIPLYLLIAFLLYRTYGWKGLGISLLGAGITILVVDQTAVLAFKEVFMRYRPTHNLDIKHIVHTVNDYNGGKYGFVSNHAANCFAIMGFSTVLLSKSYKWLTPILLVWVILVGYSRVYLGVHYPSDILGGAILGYLVAFGVAHFVLFLFKKMNIQAAKK